MKGVLLRLMTPFNTITALVLLGVLLVRLLQASPPRIVVDPELLQNNDAGIQNLSLRLHFAQADAKAFGIEGRDVVVNPNTNAERANITLREWLLGPRSSGLVNVAAGLAKPKVFLRKDTVFVDAPKTWLAHQIGSAGELLLYCGLSNSLLEIPEVTKVQFLVEGAVLPTIGGQISTFEAFTKKTCQG